MRACLLKELRQFERAEALYQRISALEKTGIMKSEKFVFPYALFDWASLKYAQGKLDLAKMLLERVGKWNDFNFEFRLFLRQHLLKKAIDDKEGDE